MSYLSSRFPARSRRCELLASNKTHCLVYSIKGFTARGKIPVLSAYFYADCSILFVYFIVRGVLFSVDRLLEPTSTGNYNL